MDILHVQEIRSYEQPTRMANTPAFNRHRGGSR
jgi:chemotaxis signal transduction protein